MSYPLRDDVVELIQQLISCISGFKHGAAFQRIEKSIQTYLRKADSMNFINEKEIERMVESLCSKFAFHGYLVQSKELKSLYSDFMPPTVVKDDRADRLSVIRLLLCLSESPTNRAHEYKKKYEKGDQEDVIDWPAYLMQGIPRWSPIFDEPSDVWSDELTDTDDSTVEGVGIGSGDADISRTLVAREISNNDSLVQYNSSKGNLRSHVQHSWFVKDVVRHKPQSDDRDANIAFLWDDHVKQLTKNLIPLNASNVISEYKMLREVIWQMYEPHESCCFQFVGNSLRPRSNVTISSVRSQALESFLYEFVPCIEKLQALRKFQRAVNEWDSAFVIADTYKSYAHGLALIMKPIFAKLGEIENRVKDQETTETLLTLACELRPLIKTIDALRYVHLKTVIDYKENSPLQCATALLHNLYECLSRTTSKFEQDLYLALYMHSLYKYFSIIHSWLDWGEFKDYKDEFVIADGNPAFFVASSSQSYRNAESQDANWQMQFQVKQLDEVVVSDEILKIIREEVLQIGRNVNLLRLLDKLHLVPEFSQPQQNGTLYEVYIEKVLAKIAAYFKIEKPEETALELVTSPSFVFPAICADECKYFTEMDRLENLVDTSCGFLMKAFEQYFVKKPQAQKEDHKTLFERISNLTKSLFPVQHFLEEAFLDMMREKYSISGLMVKNVLMDDYQLEKQFSFMKHVFLFHEDIIFLLYRRFFDQLDSNALWGNKLWLTSYLQDIIMDVYPHFYEKCRIEVKENWKLCTDPLKACTLINIHYRIEWPINVVIQDRHAAMYRDVFQFILKIKWALYTINHLYFVEIEPKGRSVKTLHKSLRKIVAKLKTLRFGFVNIFSGIQHYFLRDVFSQHCQEFDKALERAYDLQSLVEAHSSFITSLHKACMDFQEFNSSTYGFYLLLYLVRKLKIMWRNLKKVDDEELQKCENSYWLCHKHLDPLINPKESFQRQY